MSRLVVVSGGGSGIGRAIAEHFARAGDDVLILGRREATLAAAAGALNAELDTERITHRAADLSDPQQVEQVAAHLARAGRTVDVLVNNAGGFYGLDQPDTLQGYAAQWRANFEGNVLPTVLLTEALLPQLTRPGARIVTLSSIAALRGPGTYGGAKAALHPWNAEQATALGPAGITANIVAPGYIEATEFFGDRMTPAGHAARISQTLVGKAGEAAEIAAMTGYLASPEAGFVTGQVLQINGGALLGRG
ncbi:SDR family NAD(P)-dependent oxidoreductase [Kitasatospora sp. NPDC088346]|uniref:SDR family NAD(P)-dependent oxidoreductase n=1 Tax=Kitasatospora sp. NPDC088346 TaxID=3364073 RepID=UPI00380AB8CA